MRIRQTLLIGGDLRSKKRFVIFYKSNTAYIMTNVFVGWITQSPSQQSSCRPFRAGYFGGRVYPGRVGPGLSPDAPLGLLMTIVPIGVLRTPRPEGAAGSNHTDANVPHRHPT
jgi:hypothetical protein